MKGGEKKKTTRHNRAHPRLLHSVAVIVSKPKLHEKVSSVDLAVAGDVPLPAPLVHSELLAPREI